MRVPIATLYVVFTPQLCVKVTDIPIPLSVVCDKNTAIVF